MMQLQQFQVKQKRATISNPRHLAQRSLFPVFLLLAALVALPSLIAGLLLWWWSVAAYDRREFWRGLWASAVFGVIGYGTWIWLADPLPWLWGVLLADAMQQLWTQAALVLGLLWLFNLWLAPLCAPLLVGLYPHGLLRRGRAVPILKQLNPVEYQRDEEHQLAHFECMTATMREHPVEVPVITSTAPQTITIPPAPVLDEGALGRYQGGELADMVRGGTFYLPPELLELHGVIIGEPKQGKTTTLLLLAAIARIYGRRILYLDLKGSKRTAAQFLAAMSMLGVTQARIFPVEAYDGWRGDAQALYNRLMQQIDPTSHPFYRAGVGSAVVSLAVKAPPGPPRSSYEFLERLDTEWLRKAYSQDAQALREIDAVLPHIGGLALVFAGFFRGVNGALDGSWAFEDAEAAYIGIDGIAHREEAAMLGRYILDDAAHFAVARKASGDQALLIVDEFGVLESTNATGLYEQVREAGMSVYASGQSYQSLGRERDALLAASAVKILHRTGDPLPIIRYAGEREVFKISRVVGGQSDEEEILRPTANRPAEDGGGHNIMRPDKEYAVKVEEVQQLPQGHIVIITGGEGASVQVEPLQIPYTLLQTAIQFIRTAPRFTPAAPPQLPPAPQNQKTQNQQVPKQRKPAGGPTKRPQKPQFSPTAAPAPATKKAGSPQSQAAPLPVSPITRVLSPIPQATPPVIQQATQAKPAPQDNDLDDFFC